MSPPAHAPIVVDDDDEASRPKPEVFVSLPTRQRARRPAPGSFARTNRRPCRTSARVPAAGTEHAAAREKTVGGDGRVR